MNRREFISALSCSVLVSSPRLSWGQGDFFHIKSIEHLRRYQAKYVGQKIFLESYHEGGSKGSGYFTFTHDEHTDNGGTVISAVGGGYWLRSLEGGVCSVYDFGACDAQTGFDSTEAIQKAIDNCNHVSLNGGKFNISHPLYLRSNIIFDGQFGSLTTLSKENSEFMKGSIFAPGNYHPDYLQKVQKSEVLNLSDDVIELRDVNFIKAGDIVRLTSVESTLSFGFPVENFIQLARVVDIDYANRTVKIDHTIPYSGKLELTLASLDRVKGRFEHPIFCCADTIVRNVEVNTWDYWIADSCTYGVVFENIYGRAKSVIYGNSYCYTTFKNIRIIFTGSVSELAFGSHFTTLDKIYAISSDKGVTKKEMISWTEAGRNCTLTNFLIRINNSATPSTIIRVSGHSNSIIKNGQLFLFSNSNNILSVENYGNGQPSCSNIMYSNIDVYAKNEINVFCDVYKANDTAKIEDISFHNVRYFGMKPKVALLRLRGTSVNIISNVEALIYSKNGGDVDIKNARYNRIKLASVLYEPSESKSSSNFVEFSKVH